jgi:hypothetical protein
VHRALRPRLDRRMFAERHERTRGFERLLEEIGRCTSLEELVRLPGERMDALLEPESIAIYGREETVFTPVFVRGRGAPPAFESDSLLVRALERRARPLAARPQRAARRVDASSAAVSGSLPAPRAGRASIAREGPSRS